MLDFTFCNLAKKIYKNKNLHVFVFNFGVLFEENMKIKYYAPSRHKSRNCFEKYDN